MNLVVDIGNTFIKLAVFEKASLIHKKTIASTELIAALKNIKSTYPLVKNAILSSVARMEDSALKSVQQLFFTLVLDAKVHMPFANLYGTPATLGVDRLALIAAATYKFPEKDVLVIDAGTCITYDFKNKNEEYLGGAIAPGLQLRYKSLYSFTARLPLLEIKMPINHIGNNTEEAIHSGVVQGLLYEIEGTIHRYCNSYPDLTVILTGGDAHFLSKRLKNSIFATSNFLLEGLNYILAFNNSQ